MVVQAVTGIVFRHVAPKNIRHVHAPDFRRVEGFVAEVFRQMAAEFQIVPPVTLHHSVPRLMAGLWAVSREAYVADPPGRALREIVGASVSHINRCPYCVDVHVAMLHGLGDGAAAQVLSGAAIDPERLEDAQREAAAWAMATLTPAAAILRMPPFSESDAPRIIGTALLFHYLNRMVNLFLEDSPLPIPASLGWLKRNAGIAFGRTVGRQVATLGAGAEPFPLFEAAAELPDEFGWARPDPRVAAAFALFAKVAEEAGAAFLDPEIRALVVREVDGWMGEPPGMGRGWVERAVSGLPERDRPAARLALLTAFASYQVTDADIAAFRDRDPSDAALIAVTGWAGFQAMKRIGGWLHAPAA